MLFKLNIAIYMCMLQSLCDQWEMRWHNVLVCVFFVVFLQNWSDSFYYLNPALFCSRVLQHLIDTGNWSSVLCRENFRLHTLTCTKLCCLDKKLASFPRVPMKSMVGSHPCKTLWLIVVFFPLSKATSDLKFTCARVQCICVLSIVTQFFEGGRGREVGS